MRLLIDTSTSLCRVTLVDTTQRIDYSWQADRGLAKGLLGYIQSILAEQQASLRDIDSIGLLRGPGSFTGLRIGATVANTLADSLAVPIVGTIGDDWQMQAIRRLDAGDNDKIVLPEYGREARITQARK